MNDAHEELDNFLCTTYPKMFRDRHGNVQQTCMVWGFDVGIGWANILRVLCAEIQWHIDRSRKQRNSALRYNRALTKAIAGDKTALVKLHTYVGTPSDYAMKHADADIKAKSFQTVLPVVPQVVVIQVKEKFGSLRFYYNGGDEYIRGLVTMAEGMSGRTCEVCGASGKASGSGWIRTLCSEHSGNTVQDETDQDESL